MDYEYYSDRLHIHVARREELDLVVDFHKRNRLYFEKFEEPKSKDFYSRKYQLRTQIAEAASFSDSSFFRYYLSPINNPATIIGTFSFKKYTHSQLPVMLLGYKIDHKVWRNGYAYEALSYIIPRMFLSGHTTRLEALVNPDNTASVCLLSKLGFKHFPEDIVYRTTPAGTILHHLYFLESGISVIDIHQ